MPATPAKPTTAKRPARNVSVKPAPPAWHVYIVRCADDTLYTGIARDVGKRIAEHNGTGRAGARYTRARRPVVLVYQEPAADRSAAGQREYAIKQLPRSAKLALTASVKRRRGKTRPAKRADG